MSSCFSHCIYKTKNEFGQNPEENIILIGPDDEREEFDVHDIADDSENGYILEFDFDYLPELHDLHNE